MSARYQLLPSLTDAELADLRADIEAHGIRVPIDVDENGQILDGHHRSAIATMLGIDCPHRVVTGLDEAAKRDYALAVNIHRRSLTREQRRDLIAASLRSDPDLSDRQHGRRTGVDGKTVATVRGEMESTAEIPQSTTRTSADGRQRPATVTPIAARSHHNEPLGTTGKTVRVVDKRTGEVETTTYDAVVKTVDEAVRTHAPEAHARAELTSWRVEFMAAIARAGHLFRSTPEAVAEKADTELLNELRDLTRRFSDYLAEVERLRGDATVIPMEARR